jgi:hypothetical protein
MPESPEGQASAPASAQSPSVSVPPPRDPSPSVRLAQQVRELLTDLGGLALAGYLVQRGAITGLQALYFAAVLVLPSPVLLRVAKILAARGGSAGSGVAVGLLGASAAWAHTKLYAVAGAGVLGLAACLSGCPMPAPDGCAPRSTRCSPRGVPEVCSMTQRWTHGPVAKPCSELGSSCCRALSPYGNEVFACVPSSACLPERPDDAGASSEGGAL